jgi:apolipoprotein D and lipocalin family protein
MKAKAPLAAMLIALLAGCASSQPLATVASVDLKRYSGKWHEVARYPNWFQRSCTGGVTAEYTPLPDGAIRVVNSCRKADGSRQTVQGRATVVPDSGNAKLKVSFFWPITGDYWIIGLDPDYRWALVGHPSRKYLWVLSREPAMEPKLYDRVVNLAVAQGYEAAKILQTSE